MNASSHTLTGVVFDDLVNDDKRYYTMTAQGPTNTLTVQSSSQGTITATPGGTNFVKDTGVQVTAVANPGYLFASWGGALTGLANNPAIVVMDTSKSISANYVPLSNAVTLTTSAANGSISLNPPGGIYTTGTVVTVTALPNAAYAFTNWSGDLTGSVNPTNITMTGNQSVTANFALLPTYTLTSSATNGSITFNPPGGIYSSGMVVTVTATPNSGYQFDSWSGALNGSVNPTTITLNTNQSVTANFAVFTGEAVPWIETFTFADGTKADGPPTSWTATRASGVFEARTNRLTINNSGGEGVLETGEIGIGGGSVRVSVEVQGQGGLDSSGGSLDYVRFYKIVDGGPPVLIGPEILGAVTGTQTLLGTSITGGKLKLRIETLVTATDEHYFFDNLKVERESVTANYTLTTSATNGTITLNPPGGVYNAGTVVTVTAIPSSGYAFTNWSGDLAGPMNPTTITMTGNKSVTANFAVSSGLTSFRVNCGGSAYDAGGGIVFEGDGIYNIGGNTHSTPLPISGTTDDPLYQTERWGNSFSYSIPMVNGDYEVTLMFAEINFNSAGKRVFNVAIEGTQVITNLDIWAKVGKDAAYNETHVITVSDGQLNIAFSPGIENPKISAIQVQRIVVPEPFIQPPVLQGGQLRLEWVGGTLQTATSLDGPWSDVSGAASPYLNPTTNSAQFFRVKQ